MNWCTWILVGCACVQIWSHQPSSHSLEVMLNNMIPLSHNPGESPLPVPARAQLHRQTIWFISLMVCVKPTTNIINPVLHCQFPLNDIHGICPSAQHMCTTQEMPYQSFQIPTFPAFKPMPHALVKKRCNKNIVYINIPDIKFAWRSMCSPKQRHCLKHMKTQTWLQQMLPWSILGHQEGVSKMICCRHKKVFVDSGYILLTVLIKQHFAPH